MPNPQLGPRHDLAIRLGSIERQIKALLTMPTGQALSSYQSDGSIGWSVYMSLTSGLTQSVWYNGPGSGATKVNGQWPMFMSIGQITSGGAPSGVGLVAARPDGSVSLTVGNKGFGMVDKNANQLITESETAFGGFKTPQLNGQTLVNTNTATWPSTTNTTWTTIATGWQVFNNPLVAWQATGYAPAGVTGQFQITVNGTQVVQWSASGGNFQSSAAYAALPAGTTWGQPYQVNFDAYVSAGTGTIIGQVYGIWGTAST